MTPSAFQTFASSSCIRDAGMETWGLRATNAFRILVSISAIGSVITPTLVTSPACLHHAGNLPTMGQRPETDPAQPELPKHRPRPATRAAAAVPPQLERRDRPAGPGDHRALPADQGQLLDRLVQVPLVLKGLLDPHVDDDLLHPRHLHDVGVAPALLQLGHHLGLIPLPQPRHRLSP